MKLGKADVFFFVFRISNINFWFLEEIEWIIYECEFCRFNVKFEENGNEENWVVVYCLGFIIYNILFSKIIFFKKGMFLFFYKI